MFPPNTIPKLIRIERDLRRLCHNESCSNLVDCPKRHAKCRDSLSLQTAVAWAVADIAARVIMDIRQISRRDGIKRSRALKMIEILAANKFRILGIMEAVFLEKHKSEILEKIYYIAHYIVELINGSIRALRDQNE